MFDNIPSNWQILAIGDIAKIYNGNSINKTVKQTKYTGLSNGRSFIATKDVAFDGTVTYENGVKIPSSETNFKTAPADSVFVCSEGGSAGRKTAYVTQEVCFGNKLFAIVRKSELYNGKYIYYFTRSQLFFKQFQELLNGIIGGVNNKKFASIIIPVPPIEEQRRIVSRIEELFSELDSAVETLQKTRQQLEIYRQAVLKEAFEGDYRQTPLKTISKTISGYAFKSKKYSSEGEYTVIKIGNVKPFRFDFSRDHTKTNEVDESILYKYLLKKGDCLITLTGSRGKRDYGYVAMITDQTNYLLNQRVAALRFDTSIAFPKFYQYYLSSPQYRNIFFSYETGNVGQGNVGIKALIEPNVIIPSINDQILIVKEIENRFSVCDNIEKIVNECLQQAEAMRQSILKKAFEGEL